MFFLQKCLKSDYQLYYRALFFWLKQKKNGIILEKAQITYNLFTNSMLQKKREEINLTLEFTLNSKHLNNIFLKFLENMGTLP